MSTEYWVLTLTFIALVLGVGVFGIFLSSQLKKHRRARSKATTPDSE